MERSKELSFSVRNSGDAGQPTGCVGSTPGFVGDLQLLAGDELEARLQIHDRIGGGSSARVYRGTLDGATPVAVKVLHPHAAQRESTLQEFLREAQVLARLQSKHIVRLHALAHLPPNFAGLPTRRFTWGIVTELMEAGTLTKLVQYAAKVYKQQQRVKQQLAASAAAGASVGGASNAGGPDRSNSLRNLRQNLSFLRRRSLTTGGNDSAAAPPSPRTRGGGGGPVSASAGGGAGLSARLDSLTQEMPSLPYTDREALQWCMEVALALQFLHAQTPPVVHRDVKTDNVLMAPLPAPPATAPQLPLPATVSAAAAAAAAGHGTSFTAAAGGGSGTFSSHGSLARRVLSVRAAAAAAAAGEGTSSRHGSITAGLARPGDGRPLTAKLCDFGLHVVLDLTRPVVTVRRRSYESSYPAEALAMAGGGSSLPHSNSLTRRSARHSPAGGLGGLGTGVLLSPVASLGVGGGTAPGASGMAHTHSGVLPAHHGSGGVPGGIASRIWESRSRRSSLMSSRAPDDNRLLRRAVSRDGDSFSRTQTGVHRKVSNLSHADSLEHQPQSSAAGGGSAASAAGAGFTHTHLAAVASAGGSGSGGSTARSAAFGGGPGGGGGGIYASSPPKAGPFAGGGGAAAAAAAAAAAFGSTAGPGSGIGHLSSGAMAPVLVGLRGSGGGAYRSPKTSGPGSGPGPPKWSGGSVATAAAHGGLSGFAATRASLDLLLQGRLSTTAVAAASHSNASTNSVMIATGGGGSQPGGGGAAGGGGGSTAPLLPTSISHAMAAIGGGMESFSAGQMMLQLHGGSNTGMLDRVSRLRPSHAGPSTGDLGGGGGGMTLESALRIGNRSSSGRPSIAAAAALMAAGLGAGGGGPSSTPGTDIGMYGGGTAGATAPRAPRPSGGSPAASSRGGTRLRANPDLRGNAAQVEKYLAMMEEDLQLDISSRSSSKVQAEMETLYGPGSRPASQTAAGAHHRASSLLGAVPIGGMGGTLSGRRLLSAGQSQGSIPVSASLAQHQQQQQGAIGLPAASTPSNLPSPKASVTLPAADRHPPSSGAPNAPTAGGGGGGAAAVAPFTAVPGRLQASGSGSGSGAVTSPPGIVGRISSVGPNSPSSPSVPVPSTASTRSEQGMIVLTGVAYSGFGGHPAGSGSGTGLPPGGGSGGSGGGSGGGGAVAATAAAAAGGAAAATAIPSGLRSTLLRGPNPMKASSQPAMSISSSQAPGLYPHGAAPSPARGPNPMKSSSQPAMSVSGLTLVGVDSGGRVRWPPPAAAAPPPAASTDQMPKAPSLGGSGSGAGGSGYAGGTPSPSSSRGPNPVKSSSQPVMSVIAMTAAAGGGATGAHCSASRGRDITNSAVSAAGGTVLARTTSNGSRMNHLALAAPSSPTGSVHAMDLSPPAARVKSSSRMGQGHSHVSPSASAPAPAAAAVAGHGAAAAATGDVDLPQRENSATAITNNTAVRRGRPRLEVFLPGDAPGTGGGGGTDSAPTTRTLSPAGGTRAASAGGDAVAAAAVAAGRQWIATVTAAASPRTHSPAATPGGGGGGPGMLLGTNSGGADSSILPLPPIVHAAGGGGGGGSGSGVALNRELHKVVKRLRPDGGGGSFTGSGYSPLGLPPTVPMHHGNASAASGGGGEAGGGSFTYSRRTSMDSHAPSYQSIGSSRSATAALQLGGSAAAATHAAAAAGGPGMLHREKLLWGRGLLAASGSAGQSSGGAAGAGAAGGGGGLAHSGPVQTSGVLTSDPNSPVSSYSPAVGSGSLLGRGPAAALRHHQTGHLVGSSAAAAAGGSAVPRTTSGGISASGNSARQSSAGERSARQSSLVRQSSSTHSWGDYGAAGGGGAAATATAVAHVLGGGGGGGGGATASGAASGAASPSCANTATSLRNLGHPGGGGSGTGGLAAMASAVSAASGGAGGHAPSALASPMLAHVTGAGSQASSSAAASIVPQRLVSESAASSTLGGWTGRDEIPPQGEATYALTGRAGTLLYMAPEVIRHEPYNEKVDVFSFGVVLYEVFGRVLLLELYSKDELEALSGRIAQGFRHSRPDCMPQSIWDLVQQCWAQSPADRPGMPLVVRHMELALEAMDEAEAAVVVTHSGTHRAGSLFGDGGGAAAASGAGGAASGGAPASGSPVVTGTGGTGPGSAPTAGKDRSSGRSVASHRSLLSMGGSLGRRSKGLSFRRRGANHPRSPPQPTAPTPGRPPPAPANAPSPGAGGGGGAGQLGLELPGRALSAGSGLHSPTSRGSTGGGGGGGDIPGADGPLRCAPCGCVIC